MPPNRGKGTASKPGSLVEENTHCLVMRDLSYIPGRYPYIDRPSISKNILHQTYPNATYPTRRYPKTLSLYPGLLSILSQRGHH